MHVFIAGGTGVLGRRIVPALLGQGHRVTVLARHPERVGPGAEVAAGDVFDRVRTIGAIAAAVIWQALQWGGTLLLGREIKGATATFKSKSVSGDDKRAKVSGDLSAGGSSTPASMDLTLTDSKASGSMNVSHSALGIKPYSAPMGIIKVKDGVTVEFEANIPS